MKSLIRKFFFICFAFTLVCLSHAFAHDEGTKNIESNDNQNIIRAYSHLDPDKEVPAGLLKKALHYFVSHKVKIKNKSTIGVIDFSQHSSKERFYLIDMVSGRVDKYQVAHGKNSDPNYDGYATKFSNTPNSEMSSQGFYLTAETYEGSHGYSLKLDGLSSTNSNARSRDIVIHPAPYVQPGRKSGRSWGCPALDPRYSEEVIDRIKGGALIYAE
ncbi:MAG: murein L,D-transpeptidase catalytic domain family protein [Bacteriovorax sp.]